MPGIIVLDGPDCTGKSTLQDYLVREKGAVGIHLTYNADVGPRMFEYQTEWMVKAIEYSRDNLVVIDRHWISEAIYAKVFRGGSPWAHMGRMMDRVWMKHAAVYVLTLPLDINDAVKRHNENLDPSHPYDEAKFKELLHCYLDLYEGNPECVGDDYASQLTRSWPMCDRPDVLTYRIEEEGRDIKKFVDNLLHYAASWRSMQWEPALNPADQNFTGHQTFADFLIVADNYNSKINTQAHWPFYEYGNSSLFFNRLLADLDINETKILLTNAVNPNGGKNYRIREFYDREYKIVTLGKNAFDWCKHLGVKTYAALPHPQYAKRFPSKCFDYKELMREALNDK
jgi:thymidylate kinase